MKKIKSPKNQQLLDNKGHILVGYLTAGYPDRESFYETILECEKAHIDVFEIGYPAKEPMADGEVIQLAHQAIDMSISTDLLFWQKVRQTVERPIWLMAYKKDIMQQDFYLELAENKLIDAIIIPDMTIDERLELENTLASYEVDVVGFISPDMNYEQVQRCLEYNTLIYQQLYSGPTGMEINSDNYSELLSQAKQYKDVNVFAGFGISTPERVRELLLNGFDGVIVGTAMMKKRMESLEELLKLVNQLKEATKGVRENEVHCNI
jgi:tryptophan synthase alpha chain